MRRPSRTGLPWLIVLCICNPLTAQNLEFIGREKPLSFSGGVSFQSICYVSRALPARRERWNTLLSGNLNAIVFGWSIPATFSLSNRAASFTQPFNRFSLKPSWKWVTVHAGYSSMSLSPYSVNGHVFNGVAVELTPAGRWSVSGLFGRFLKSVKPDTIHSPRAASYQRMGYAFKAQYGDSKDYIGLTLFRAEDRVASLPPLADSLRTTPHENLAVSVSAGKSILRNLLLKTEVGASAITTDTRAQKAHHNHVLTKAGPFFTPRLTSSYYKAIRTSADFRNKSWTIGILYERVDPGYRTLGAYYFNNDLENFSVNGTAVWLNGRMNISASAGTQRDNLDRSKISTLHRIVNALNVTYAAPQKFNVAAAWSNFRTITRMLPLDAIEPINVYDDADTLTFRQISQSASATFFYALTGTREKRKSVNVHLTWQASADAQGEGGYAATNFYNLMAGYAVVIPSKATATFNLNASKHGSAFTRSAMLGPSVSLSRACFGKKLRLTLSCAVTRGYLRGAHVNNQLTGKVTGVFNPRGKHNMTFTSIFANRRSESSERATTEFTATFGYNCTFGRGRH